MRWRSSVWLAVALAVFCAAGTARADDGDGARFTPVPILAYFPETSLMFGGLAIYTLPLGGAARARRSSITALAAYTLKNQFLLSAGPVLHLAGGDWRVRGRAEARWFPDTFYAIGPQSPSDSSEPYTERVFGASGDVTARLWRELALGGRFDVAHLELTETEPGGLLDGGVAGAGGGLVFGAGPLLSFDDRDHDIATHSGGLYEMSLLLYRDFWASDYDFLAFTGDARHFLSLGGGAVLGGQIFVRLTSGDVPFFRMSELGGPQRLRGLFEGRFRDRHMVTSQVELQAPLFWRFRGALFVGAGSVAPAADAFEAEAIEVGGGAGLRVALDRSDRIYLRLDGAGATTGAVHFYASVGEAF